MKINCLFDELLDIGKIFPHPKNFNSHPREQIERLAKILEYQGWRYPIKISKRSGFITSGHGRLSAAILNKWEKVPVNYQDYESEDQEIADLISDNAVALWSDLDLALVNSEMINLGPDYNIDLLGIENFKVDLSESLKLEDINKEEKPSKFILEVSLSNEMELRDLYDDLSSKGFTVKEKNK